MALPLMDSDPTVVTPRSATLPFTADSTQFGCAVM
jgi:hypothetical protein